MTAKLLATLRLSASLCCINGTKVHCIPRVKKPFKCSACISKARILDLQNFLSKTNPVTSVYHLQELLHNKLRKLESTDSLGSKSFSPP